MWHSIKLISAAFGTIFKLTHYQYGLSMVCDVVTPQLFCDSVAL